MVREGGVAVLQAGAGAADSDTQPINIMLWQSATLASATKTSRLPLQRLHKVGSKNRVNQKKNPKAPEIYFKKYLSQLALAIIERVTTLSCKIPPESTMTTAVITTHTTS